MKLQITFLIALFISLQGYTQSSITDYVKEGIKQHDKGEYDKAITTYKKALKLNPKSPLVNYEIALSYFSKADYKNAIKYADVVLKQKGKYMNQAYMTKGSSLDMLGKTKESIKLFKKAIKETEPHYLLYYNLALNYFKTSQLEDAETNVIKALEINPNHASSHLMLTNIHHQKGNTVQAVLAAHYFLFLEPNSQRSNEGYQILQKNFGGDVAQDKNKSNTVNISLDLDSERQFGSAALMIGLLEASKYNEENEGKTDVEMFIKNTESFFKILGELKEENDKDIWATIYIPFFYDLANSDHLETYCHYIAQNTNENSQEWLSTHKNKLIDFDNWLKAN